MNHNEDEEEEKCMELLEMFESTFSKEIQRMREAQNALFEINEEMDNPVPEKIRKAVNEGFPILFKYALQAFEVTASSPALMAGITTEFVVNPGMNVFEFLATNLELITDRINDIKHYMEWANESE